MTKAAGILFVSMNGNALFLRRTATAPDCPGCWDLPGGGREADETAEQTAIRETREEIGFLPDGKRVFHTRTASPADGRGVGTAAPALLPVSPAPSVPFPADVDFTTFLQSVTNEFTPELDEREHDGWAWAPIASPPEPLHPGVRISLDRLAMDELGVARAVADGRLTSPQRYENVTLFAIRITGTDTAYRAKHNEFVYRNPDHYLNEEFLARCNGLPVIFKHPVKSPLLNSAEFLNRIVGTVFLPYISGDEVWAIVKIYVDTIAALMEDEGLSTSPGVNFQNFAVNARLKLEDGAEVLIEGKPSLLDHVAICELGVWDKGGEPAGIRIEAREDSTMTPEEEAAAKAKKDAAEAEEKAKKDAAEAEEKAKQDAARKDADVGTKLDKVLSHLDAVGSKMDSFGKRLDAVEDEKKRADAAKKDEEEKAKKDADEKAAAEKAAADKAKKDADEEAEKKKREDAAKNDSDDVRKRIDEVAAMIPRSYGDADYAAITDAQARADDIYMAFGKAAPRPLNGESRPLYERRVVRDLAKFSPTWGKDGVDVSTAFADDAAFNIVRDQVYNDAAVAAKSPTTAPDGGMRMITKRGPAGHTINEFVGDSRSWLYPMTGATRQYASGRFDDSSIRGGR